LSIDVIDAHLGARLSGLPARLRAAAEYALSHPEEVSHQSMRALAASAGVSPASMLRLIRNLGFDGYETFQAAFRGQLASSERLSLSDRGRLLLETGTASGLERLVAAVALSERSNIDRSFGQNPENDIINAAVMLHSANSVTLVGARSCFPVAFYLKYLLDLFRSEVRLVPTIGGNNYDQVVALDEGDVVTAISIHPYSRETVEATTYARLKGVKIISITDSTVSPIARLADLTLVVANDTPSFFRSPISMMAIAHAIGAAVVAIAGDEVIAKLREREEALRTSNAYWQEG
jgi:DNA-binding MurR/RpiR family transcriptional regulator